MKQFKNLHEAFNYQSRCPLCSEPIEVDYKEQIANDSWDKPKIVTIFQLSGGDEISIDYYTNEVRSYTEAKSYNYAHGSPSVAKYCSGNYNIYKSGTLFFGVNASCLGCSKYGFTLQIAVDWASTLASGIFLNSESVSIEDGDALYEIKNIYATEKTTYDKFTKVDIDDGTVKMSGFQGRQNSTITFPLMPLDPKNPRALLDRIKKLIIFS